jgi:lysine-specific demethylase/histidyl-hydroxylase NO66
MNAGATDATDDAFGVLVSPVSTSTFFDRYFERDPLHVERSDASYFAGLYSVRCVEDALVLGADDPDHFTLIKHESPDIARDGMTSERSVIRFRSARQPARTLIDPRSVLAAFDAGYTLNIKDAGAYHPSLAQLCNAIQAQLGFYVHTNVYFTPPGNQGFGTHYDTHDTLIVQIEGEKLWRIYEPVVALPLERQPFSKSVHDGKLGTPRSVHLRAGDSLYIPHGFPHDATASEGRALHVTFALAPIRVVDLLDSLTQLAAFGDPELRRALPPGWHRDPSFAARMSARLGEIMPRAFAPERIPLAAELAHNELFAATRTTAAGAFDTLAALQALQPESRIALRADTPFHVRDRGDRLDIVLAAKVVSVPGTVRAALLRLQSGAATFAEIEAGLPAGDGRSLIRTLVLEGLVRVHEAPCAIAH